MILILTSSHCNYVCVVCVLTIQQTAEWMNNLLKYYTNRVSMWTCWLDIDKIYTRIALSRDAGVIWVLMILKCVSSFKLPLSLGMLNKDKKTFSRDELKAALKKFKAVKDDVSSKEVRKIACLYES